MINTVKKTVCALAVLATTSTTVMAGSIDVKIIGTITPTACKPTLTGGGTIDYGTINSNMLEKDDFTILTEKQIDFSITCDAPAKVAVKVIDGRTNTAAGVSLGADSFAKDPTGKIFNNGTYVAGLGLDGDKKIGGYSLRLAVGTIKADGVDVDSIWTDRPATNWIGPVTRGDLFHSTAPYNSWTKKGEKTPIAFSTLTGKLGVQAYINKASELDLTKPVKLDGLATLELVYL